MVLEHDMPTADQILQIHAVCRTLDLPLPREPSNPVAMHKSGCSRRNQSWVN
jgi:hypothetical protein